MRGAIVAVLLVLSLIVFGCCGAVTPSTNQTNDTTAPTKKPGETAGTPGEGMEAPGETTGTPPAPPSGNGSSAPAGDSFGGKDWAGLIALGVPAQCDITSNGTATKMYMVEQGKKLRMETSSQDCEQNVIIMKDQKMYMACVGGEQMMPGCDWLQFDVSGAGTPSGSPYGDGSSAATDYQDAPSSSFDCEAWVPDASKFETPGKVCNLQDMYGAP